MHVPALLRVPGVLKPGQVWDRPMISMDLMPTFLALADPSGRPLAGVDGQNILPVLAGKAPDHEFLFWSFENQRSVRQGDWKLILNPPQFTGDPATSVLALGSQMPSSLASAVFGNPKRGRTGTFIARRVSSPA